MDHPLPFVVVEFIEEKLTEAVSSCWLTPESNRCWWPTEINPNIPKLVKTHVRPSSNWKLHPCRLLRRYGNN